jgi:hypothetical protein
MSDTKQIIFGGALEFDEKKHAYKWNEQYVPGVTTILQCIGKPALIPWAAGCASDHWLAEIKRVNGESLSAEELAAIHKAAKGAHRAKAKAAANIGQNVHDYAECVFKGLTPPELLTDQAKRGAEAFHKWLDAHNVKIKASERRVFSKEYYYAGTCDFVAEIDGVWGVGDIKTSSGIYPEMRFQTAAYQQALEEEKGFKFPVRWIVRFDKITGNFEAKSFYDFEKDFEGFHSALKLHRALQAIESEEESA